MVTYDKDALILEYLTMIQKQDKELIILRANKQTLEARAKNLKRDSVNYRAAAVRWKEAYEELNEEFITSNKVVCDLVSRPLAQIEQVIKAYKENI